jgi:hypothetical protein
LWNLDQHLLRFMDRRRDLRFACGITVEVIDAQDGSYLGQATIRDISRGGVGIQMERYVVPGTTIRMRSEHRNHVATVRHLTANGNGYFMGCAFAPEEKPNEEVERDCMPALW